MTGHDTPPAIRLLIADDQPLIRRALALTLGAEPDIEVTGQAVDGLDALEQALAQQPDVVVMDLQMPRVSGVVATREIATRLPATGIVVLTTFDDDDLVFDAIRAGARAYLLKDATEDEVLETVRAVHRGESRLSPSIARKVMEQFRRLDPMAPADAPQSRPEPPMPARVVRTAPAPSCRAAQQEPLSDKERRVLQFIAEGLSNKQIGTALFLAEGTVKNYVSRIMAKLHAHSRTELAVRAVRGPG